MNIDDIKYYHCTICGGPFQLGESLSNINNSEIINGSLKCISCSAEHPILNGLPRFVSDKNYSESFGYQWNNHRRTQLDSYTGLPLSRNRLFSVTKWPVHLQGHRILEAGSGAGRFTEILVKTGAEIFSFDYSNAIDANYINNKDQQNLHLFQGDIFSLPLEENSFDKVLCLGVLQHTPDPEKAFKKLSQFVKPGGEIVIDVYKLTFLSCLHWKYLLRPFTKRIDSVRLYQIVSTIVPHLLPLAAILRRIAGRFGARLVPIMEYSHLNLSPEIGKEWAILDTFDMYSPAYDRPQRISTVNRWLSSLGFQDVSVQYGPNGIIAKGKKPLSLNHIITE